MSEEFSPGIKIIIDRIREFPDDFTDTRSAALYTAKSSWHNLVGEIMSDDAFTNQEKKAVKDALRIARRAQFDARVLDLLAGGPETVEDFNKLYGQAIQGAIATGTGVVQPPNKLLISRAQMEIARKLGNATPKMEGGPI